MSSSSGISRNSRPQEIRLSVSSPFIKRPVGTSLLTVGLLLALDMSLPTLLKPLGRGARTVGAALTAPAAEDDEPLPLPPPLPPPAGL